MVGAIQTVEALQWLVESDCWEGMLRFWHIAIISDLNFVKSSSKYKFVECGCLSNMTLQHHIGYTPICIENVF